MKTILFAVAGLLAVLAGAALGQTPVTVGDPSTPQLKPHEQRFTLHKSDTFEVDFSFSPELNQTVIVDPDGYVTLKEIGSIHVEGETLPALTEKLKQAYAGILRDPVIAVVMKDFEKPSFIATGQVMKPGRYDLRGPLTVTQAVAIAGGFSDNAKHSQVVLFHPTEKGLYEARLLDVKHLLASRNLNQDFYLQPGDLIYVPQSLISKIRKFWPNTAVGAYYNPNGF